MNRSEYIASRAVLADWASPDASGRARASWTNACIAIAKEDPKAPAFTIDFGRSTCTVCVDGTIAKQENTDTTEQLARLPIGVHIDTGIPVGAAPTNKMAGNFRFPTGGMFVIAGGDAGKTPAVHAFAGMGDTDYEIVRFGEPLAGYLSDERAGAIALATAMFRSPHVIVDSIKDLLAMAAGGAMKSGLSRGALPMMSRWGAVAASMGCTLYVPVNPSSDDDDVFKLLVEATRSNATSLVFSAGPDRWEYVNRRGEGLQREKGHIETHYTSDGVLEIRSSSVETVKSDSMYMPESVKLSSKDLNDAIRRSVKAI